MYDIVSSGFYKHTVYQRIVIMVRVYRKTPDQTAHSCSLVWVFAIRNKLDGTFRRLMAINGESSMIT